MGKYIVTILFFLTPLLGIKSQMLSSVRQNFLKAVDDKAICKKMITELSTSKDVVLIGYLGAYQTLWANHASNPFEKFSTFTKGKKNLEKSIAMDSQNIETRILRLSVQKNAPGFLGYKANIKEDRDFILKNKLLETDEDVQNLIKRVL